MTDPAVSLLAALGIGLLLGVERERRKGRGPERGPAGIRTFGLVALLGGLAYRVGGVAVTAVALGVVGLAAVAGYVTSGDDDPGMTTEVALLVDFLLGALTQHNTALAVGLGVSSAILLAGRERLHRFVRDTLSERELHDGLLFAACALIVLPLVPDHGVGPNHSLNPAIIWRLVVIVMAMQGAGYVALRAVGPRYGLLLTGFLGGFVSSTAMIAVMGRRAVEEPRLRRLASAAGIASSVATIVLLAAVVGAASVPVLRVLALPMILAGLAAVGYALVFGLRAVRQPEPDVVEPGRAFDLKVALLLAATVTLVLLVAGALNAALGRAGLVLGTAVAGFADSQSAAISAATLTGTGHVTATGASIATLAALTTNTVSKAALAAGIGKMRYALEVWPGLALILVGAWGGFAITQAG
ncbi:MAG TPA: DUF4010 domain-containing protein [Solirubrobacteraceae bacterium]|nr:DUF4010 domain-containing protein [Solirubrobacteraceae bacterium]